MPPPSPNLKNQIVVLWTLWMSLVSCMVVIQFALGHGIPQGSDAPSSGANPIVVAAMVEIVVATFIRWFLIPRVAPTHPGTLVLMIIGVALSEGAEFFGIFLVSPEMARTKLVLFGASLLSALQFAPVYALPKHSSPFYQNNTR